MKFACFTFLLSALNSPDNTPPKHIEDLLKNRFLYQLKSQKSEEIIFDDPSCTTLAVYDYQDGFIKFESSDGTLNQSYIYSDLIEGKKLDLNPLLVAIENKKNTMALLALNSKQENKHIPEEPSESMRPRYQKILAYVIGGAALSLGGWYLYNSTRKKGGSSGEDGISRYR